MKPPSVPADCTVGAPARWASVCVRLDNVPLLDVLARCSGVRFFFENDRQHVAYAACGAALSVSAAGPHRFSQVQAALRTHGARLAADWDGAPSEARPRWFGGFSFRDAHAPQGVWAAFPAAHFVLPKRQWTRVDGETWLALSDRLWAGESIAQASRRLLAAAAPPMLSAPAHGVPTHVEFLMDQNRWCELVHTTTDRIRRGELDKVVLAQVCRIQATAALDPLAALARLARAYPGCHRFLVEPAPGAAFFGATPELLARVDGAWVETVAMAGSIRRGATPAEDDALGQQLLKTPKELHEHALVVRSMAKRLSPLTRALDVPEAPEVVRFSNIQHLQTRIAGTLERACGVLPVIEALHPTPAMGGTPRQAALRLIEAVEPFARGWYAAPVGWVDLEGNGAFVVAIRSALANGACAHLFAGAGIVADSDPEAEWDEIGLKFRPVRQALGLHA